MNSIFNSSNFKPFIFIFKRFSNDSCTISISILFIFFLSFSLHSKLFFLRITKTMVHWFFSFCPLQQKKKWQQLLYAHCNCAMYDKMQVHNNKPWIERYFCIKNNFLSIWMFMFASHTLFFAPFRSCSFSVYYRSFPSSVPPFRNVP